MKAFLDKHFNRFVSKKLAVMIVATVAFLGLQLMPSDQWLDLAKWYCVSQAAVDGLKAIATMRKK